MGPDHPDTLTSRANLAAAYHAAHRMTDAVALLERTLADCEQVTAPGSPADPDGPGEPEMLTRG